MASGPITSWQIDRETVETVSDFIFWGSKITAASDCSHEIKRCLPLGRKVMTNLDSILKNRDITLPTKIQSSSQSYGFSSSHVWMWELDIKKAECWRIDVFELWCWRRLLRVPWTARRSNQSILQEISPGCSLEGLTLKLKLQILWPPDVKSWLIWKDPDTGKDWRREEMGTTEDKMVGWHHGLDGCESVNSGSWWWTGRPGMLRFMGSQRVRHD